MKKLHRTREDHLETSMFDFEFLKIPVCRNYDHALTEIYGDWHEYVIGTSIHGDVLFDTSKPYTYYI
jgi:hypothetical protein